MALKKINPTITKSWKRLKKHYKNQSEFSLKKAFQDENRMPDFTIKSPNLLVDYSKNLITSKTINLLIDLANECDLKDAINKKFSGKIINETENRAVLHTALRNFSTEKILVDDINVMPEVNKSLAKMKLFSEAVISGKQKGFTNKPFTDVVNIGIGGSDLGPKMVVESLQFYKNHLNTHFVSNIDGDHVQEILKKL